MKENRSEAEKNATIGVCYHDAGNPARNESQKDPATSRATHLICDINISRFEAVKRWDWLRAETAITVEKQGGRQGACPSFFTTSSGYELNRADGVKRSPLS